MIWHPTYVEGDAVTDYCNDKEEVEQWDSLSSFPRHRLPVLISALRTAPFCGTQLRISTRLLTCQTGGSALSETDRFSFVTWSSPFLWCKMLFFFFLTASTPAAPQLRAKLCHLKRQMATEVRPFFCGQSWTFKQPDWYKLKWESKPDNAGLFASEWRFRKECEKPFAFVPLY